jgi:hypothetical protein
MADGGPSIYAAISCSDVLAPLSIAYPCGTYYLLRTLFVLHNHIDVIKFEKIAILVL